MTQFTNMTNTNNAAADTSIRARLLEAIQEASYEQTAQETLDVSHTQVQRRSDTWWNHIVAAFFLGDEARMFRELRIDRVVFEEIVNAVVDLPLQRRGRRSFIFSHDERAVFSRVRRTAFFKNCLRSPSHQTLDSDNKVNPKVADGLG